MSPSSKIDIIYVPADCGSVIPGKSKAPKAFQDVGLARKLRDAGVSKVSEHNALESPAEYSISDFARDIVRNEELNISVCYRVDKALQQTLEPSTTDIPFQLIVGGECGMSPGILAAFWRWAYSHSPALRLGFLYIDADADLNTPNDRSFAGTFAGMNMTHLLRTPGAFRSMDVFSRPTGEPLCDASNTVFFGMNVDNAGNTREQLAFLLENGFRVVTSASVAKDPVQNAKSALSYLEENSDVILVHLDVDSIDPKMFPLANIPNYTGVAFEDMMQALKVVLASPKVKGLTVAEVNPDHDIGLDMTTRLTDHLVNILAAKPS